VLDAMAESVARLCGVYDAVIWRLEGDGLRPVAHHGPVGSLGDRVVPVHRGTVAGRTVLDRQTVQVTDLQAEVNEFPEGSAFARQFGHRSIVSVPLLREGVAIGVMSLRRAEVQPFTEKQIDLLKTFADQAVIAIENARLFSELQQKNEALTKAHAQVTESLDQQTATSEILRVMSRSQTDVQPVFDTIVQSAVRLCAGLFGALFQFDGELLHMVAHHNYTPEALEAAHGVYPARPSRDHGSVRAIVERAVVHIPDVELDPEHQHRELRRAIGQRSGLFVPMLREGDPIGVIMVARPEPGPFSNNEIELLKTFADQAVIAIENVRLFNETKEALERQTATANILRVISSSPTNVQPTFEAIAESATRLCGAVNGLVFRFDGELIHVAAHHSIGGAELNAILSAFPLPPGRGSVAGRAIGSRRVVHVEDLAQDPEYEQARVVQAGFRTALSVPMLRDGVPIGTINVMRMAVAPFSPSQISLLQTFPDQAVIG